MKKLSADRGEFFALILLSTTGMMLLASTLELITLYVSLELTTIPVVRIGGISQGSTWFLGSRAEVSHTRRGLVGDPALRHFAGIWSDRHDVPATGAKSPDRDSQCRCFSPAAMSIWRW